MSQKDLAEKGYEGLDGDERYSQDLRGAVNKPVTLPPISIESQPFDMDDWRQREEKRRRDMRNTLDTSYADDYRRHPVD